MSRPQRSVFFLDATKGGRFCILTRPCGVPVGSVLLVPPFGEELNKCRRMLALAANAFSERGWLVLRVDLFGCGDSGGDFADSTMAQWRDDLSLGWSWLESEARKLGVGPARVIWSVRAGSLLLGDWLSAGNTCSAALLWQPVLSGRQYLTQWLRLGVATSLNGGAGAELAMSDLRSRLMTGISIELGGYEISPAMALELEAANLGFPEGGRIALGIYEIASGIRAGTLSPAISHAIKDWSARGMRTFAESVEGASFWQTQAIVVVPELIQRSLVFLEDHIL